MSTPILPFAVWASGTNQNSIPANDNSLRNQILNGNIIADDVTAQPGSPDDGDAYIIPSGATGTQWESFDENDLVIYQSGTWYAYAPVEGIVVNIAGALQRWTGSAYTGVGTSGGVDSVNSKTGAVTLALGDLDGVDADSPGDGDVLAWDDNTGTWVPASVASGSDDLTIITEATAFTANPATHSGRSKLILAGGDVTFDDGEAYVAGNVFNIRATASIDLVEDGVTLTPPSGGTLALDAGMSVTVAMTGATAGVVIGQTVAA